GIPGGPRMRRETFGSFHICQRSSHHIITTWPPSPAFLSFLNTPYLFKISLSLPLYIHQPQCTGYRILSYIGLIISSVRERISTWLPPRIAIHLLKMAAVWHPQEGSACAPQPPIKAPSDADFIVPLPKLNGLRDQSRCLPLMPPSPALLSQFHQNQYNLNSDKEDSL
ncbi:hypothetical protein Pfo_000464, partial [Paulownia fortunei]